jgi:hypothetical protein
MEKFGRNWAYLVGKGGGEQDFVVQIGDGSATIRDNAPVIP